MKITLNVHSRLAKLYVLFYDRSYLPNNLCSYFWLLLVALIFTPLCYPAMLFNYMISRPYYNEEHKMYHNGGFVPTLVGAFLNLMILCGGFFFTTKFYGSWYEQYIPFWKAYANGIILTIGFCVAIYGLVHLIKFIVKVYPKRVPKEKPELTREERHKLYEKEKERLRLRQLRYEKSFWYILRKYFIAWKNKNCPIIDWETKK